MNVTELTEAMQGSRAPSAGPDLDDIRRRGRTLAHLRRARIGVAAAVAAAVLAAPWTLLPDADHDAAGFSDRRGTQDSSPEQVFLSTAPFAEPVGSVVDVDMKFYVREHGSSVGSIALWAEEPGPRLAYGSRAIDGDLQVRRAGYLDAPVLPRRDGRMVRVPGPVGEPTYVGLIANPDARVVTATVRTRSTDTDVRSGVSTTADPGYLLVWVSATTGSEAGIDLLAFAVRGDDGAVLARGTFG
ncbi:hypothetical protein ABIE44_000401 [Marmoricola sp. OAE513]|uniref:hypothetical protein n=1 Tax=Marmoricola sp. OAE513 TaxID=2817894 RepID=UPI001AE3FBFB